MVILEEIKIGVEVETTLLTRREVAEAIRTVVGGTVEHIGTPSCYDPYRITDARGLVWNVVADSSLTSAPPEKRAEIVSPILGYDDIPQLQEIIRAVRRAGARAGADAGLHVHVSSEHVTPKALANLCKMVYKQEEIIYAALGVSDVRKARYCKPLNPDFIRRICTNPPRTYTQLNTQWYGRYTEHPQRYDQTRYCAINLNGWFIRSAVEIRCWQGSLHAGEVRAAIIFCMALLAKAINSKAASAKKRTFDPASGRYDMRVLLISALGLNGERYKSVRKHLLSRIPGDSAFKWGKSQRPTRTTKKAEATIGAGAEMLQPSY